MTAEQAIIARTAVTRAMPRAAFSDVRDLAVAYRRGGRALDVVNGVSFDVRPGEIFGLVGESGSGKSTVIRSLIQLLPANATIGGGERDLRAAAICSVSGSGRCSRSAAGTSAWCFRIRSTPSTRS